MAVAYLLYRVTFAPLNSEFAGLPLILLELPWSPFVVAAADRFGVIAMFDRLGGRSSYALSTLLSILTLHLPIILLNAGLLYLLGVALGRASGNAMARPRER